MLLSASIKDAKLLPDCLFGFWLFANGAEKQQRLIDFVSASDPPQKSKKKNRIPDRQIFTNDIDSGD